MGGLRAGAAAVGTLGERVEPCGVATEAAGEGERAGASGD